jgi:hypothetical protein
MCHFNGKSAGSYRAISEQTDVICDELRALNQGVAIYSGCES